MYPRLYVQCILHCLPLCSFGFYLGIPATTAHSSSILVHLSEYSFRRFTFCICVVEAFQPPSLLGFRTLYHQRSIFCQTFASTLSTSIRTIKICIMYVRTLVGTRETHKATTDHQPSATYRSFHQIIIPFGRK